MTTFTATYSPEDNKLRLYASTRLDSETYARVKEAGFKWVPKQELFVAPMWTPAREDLLTELAGEIEDEDKSLVDRQTERAERFDDYSDKRAEDSRRAQEAVAAIADNIPLGQPILVGHHSERRARKDAERIETGMRKAVKMWRTSEYWAARAAGALAHAKYKELPTVRARRIKTIEADLRKQTAFKLECEKRLRFWSQEGITLLRAKAFASMNSFYLARKEGDRSDFSGTPSAWDVLNRIETGEPSSLFAPRTLEEVIQAGRRAYPPAIARAERWIEHYANRLVYERAMLAEQIGVDDPGKRWNFAPGGRVLVRDEWRTVLRINKSGGKIVSLRVQAGASKSLVNVELVKDYQEPTEENVAKVKKATAVNPLCNYPGEGIYEITKEQYEKIPKDYRGFQNVKGSEKHGAHRTRCAIGSFVMPKGDGKDWTQRHCYHGVFITDAKRVDPPAPTEEAPVVFGREKVAPAPVQREPEKEREGAETIAAMQSALKAGVQVVAVPQLFETSRELARRVVDLAEIRPGHRVLEPSAGTGRLLEQIPDGCEVTAVETNNALAGRLRNVLPTLAQVLFADFLECGLGELNGFDRIVMNPPFGDGADIKHIRHALTMLAPGGRLVAICANGPRQRDQLEPGAADWIDLPPGAFKESGTTVNAAIVIFDRTPAEVKTLAEAKA